MFISPYVAGIFIGYDAELLVLTTRAFRLYGLKLPHHGVQRLCVVLLHGAGRWRDQCADLLPAHPAVRVAAVLVLPRWGIDGIWLAIAAAELAALAVSVYMFVTKDKKFHYRHAK